MNHIKDKIATYQRVFPFDRLPKPLKKILNISTMPLGGTHLRLAMPNNLCQSSSVVGQRRKRWLGDSLLFDHTTH